MGDTAKIANAQLLMIIKDIARLREPFRHQIMSGFNEYLR